VPVSQDTAAQIFAIFEGYACDDIEWQQTLTSCQCPEPKDAIHTMASRRSSASLSQRTKSTKSTKATDVSSTTKLSSAYGKDFEQHLNDNNIYLHGRKSKPKNKTDLHQSRPSLSPSKFSDGDFERFQDDHEHLGSEGDVMRKIIPVIAGNASIPNSGEVLFSNLESITDGATVDVKPDFYDGARFGDIHATVRNDLNSLIIPSATNAARRPAAPNFFLEAKAPWGGADVAKRQAGLDGAIGARAMHALQNYGEEEPAFDGNAYTYTSTYHAGTGTLQLYAHHATPPTALVGRPEYHMTQVDGWQMTGNIDTFRRGATAFRNARDLMQKDRVDFIQAANAKARQSSVGALPEPETTVAAAEQYEDSTAEEFVDCEDFATQAVGTEDYAAPGNVDEESALPHYLEDEEPSQQPKSLGVEPPLSFTSSFTVPSQASSKRNGNSPPSNSRPRKKHESAKKQDSAQQHDSGKKRTLRRTLRRAAGSSVPGSTSSGSAVPLPASVEEYWSWSDEYQK
jgi:hypothetical protein